MNKNKDSKYVIANKLAKFLYIYISITLVGLI